MHKALLALVIAAPFVFTLLSATEAAAAEPDAWTKEKCVRYGRAWQKALNFTGRQGISENFIHGNETFIAEGCSTGADVCPRSPEEINLANVLTTAAMNFGTASSFLPFICRAR